MTTLDSRVAKLELTRPQVRDVVLCHPCTHSSLPLVADGVHREDKRIHYTSQALLDDYLAAQKDSNTFYIVVVAVEGRQ